MKIIMALAGLITLFWLSWLTINVRDQPFSPASTNSTELASLKQKISELENRLDRQSEVAQSFSDNFPVRNASSFNSPGADIEALPEDVEAVEDSATSVDESADQRENIRNRWASRNNPQIRLERLEEQGFARDEASRILELEQQLQIDSLTQRWEERREQYLDNPQAYDSRQINPLRAELGDDAYARYLEAMGRPTSVEVGSIMDGSNAALAGLRSGDQIISYNGERVFNLRDLDRLNVQNSRGASVTIEVLRNGERIQTTMLGGPLGIRARRGRY